MKLIAGREYVRGDGSRCLIVGVTKDHPEYMYSRQGDWFEVETGRFVSYSPTARQFRLMPEGNWRNIVSEVQS